MAAVRRVVLVCLATVAWAQTPPPWWDNYPRIVHFVNQACGARPAAKAVVLNADVVACNSVADPNVGIWAQRVSLLEESERQALDKLHAAGLRIMAYFEAYGQSKTYVVEVRRTPGGAWLKDPIDPQLTRKFLNHWNWDRFDGTGEVRYAGAHSYFDDEEFSRPYTRTHPRYGSPPVRYPDGTIATGYNGADTDPRNSRIYDACGVKDVNGNLYFDYGFNRGVERRGGPFTGLMQVGDRYASTFDIGKDAVCPSWVDYARASVLQAIDAGLDSMFTDNFSSWDSFGYDPVKKAFGEWSVAGFREYLASHFSADQLKAMGVEDARKFDVRAYLRDRAAQWGGNPGDLADAIWKSPRWLEDPVWRAYKIHRRQNGTEALSKYYHAVKTAAASAGKPDFPVTGNDFQGFNLGWARGELDMINSEVQYTEAAPLGAGKFGYQLPPSGSYVAMFKRAREHAAGRLGIFWFYVAPELANHPGIADVLQYQGLANHILPEPWTGVARPQTAGTDESTAAFNSFLGSARATFGQRTGVEEIGVYYSSSSELAHLTLNGWPDRNGGPLHSLSFLAWGTALSWLHQQWRAIPEWKLNRETLAGLKLLIVPNAEVFDPADAALLKDWTARGGKLIVAGESGVRAGEKGNFERLSAPSLAEIGVQIPDDPGPAFTNAKEDRPTRLPRFASALRDMGFSSVVDAPNAPYTVGITLYDDPRHQRRFVDINNTDIDVASDLIHPAPALDITIALPAWLKPDEVAAQLLTPDGSDVAVEAKPQSDGKILLKVRGVKRYASIVLSPATGAPRKTAVAIERTRTP